MNQQKLEKALREIARALDDLGSPVEYEKPGAPREMAKALYRIASTTRTTLKEIDDGRRNPQG